MNSEKTKHKLISKKFWKISQIFGKILAFLEKKCDFRCVQSSALCRSRRELSNAYLLVKFGFCTAENEPSKVCPIEQCAADEGALHRLGAIASVQGQYDKAEGSAPSLRVLHHHSPWGDVLLQLLSFLSKAFNFSKTVRVGKLHFEMFCITVEDPNMLFHLLFNRLKLNAKSFKQLR